MRLETLSPYDNMILAQISTVQILLLLASHQIFINSPGWQSLFSPDNLMRSYRIEFIMLFSSLHKWSHSVPFLNKKKKRREKDVEIEKHPFVKRMHTHFLVLNLWWKRFYWKCIQEYLHNWKQKERMFLKTEFQP